MKHNLRERYNVLARIFEEVRVQHEHLTELTFFIRADTFDGRARLARNLPRIDIPAWTLTRHPIVSIHFLLHEMTHHIVGFEHDHDDFFHIKERNLHYVYGIALGVYDVKDRSGNYAYASWGWPVDNPIERISLFR